MRWRATICYARISLSARKRDKYWKPAGKRQADGRYGVGGGKAERAAWFANPLGAGRKRVRREKLGGTPKVKAKCESSDSRRGDAC
jgi:hypothetical protein